MKKIALFFFFFFLFCLTFVLSLPMLLSTSYGTSITSKILSSVVKKGIQIQKMDLSWWGSQEIQGVSIQDRTRDISFSCKKVQTKNSLFQLALGMFKGEEGSLEIEQGRLIFSKAQLPRIECQDIDFNLAFSKDRPLVFKAKGKTFYDKSVEGSFSAEGSFSPLDHTFKASAILSHFPTSALDQIGALSYPFLSGKITQLIGPFMEANVLIEEKEAKGNFSLSLQSDKTSIEASCILQDKKPSSFKLKTGPLIVEGITIQPFTLEAGVDAKDEHLFHITLDSPQIKISPLDLIWNGEITLKAPLSFSGALQGSIETLHIPPKLEDATIQASFQTQTPLFSSPLILGFSAQGYRKIDLSLQNPDLQATLTGSLDPNSLRFKGQGSIKTITFRQVTLEDLGLELEVGKKAPLLKATLSSDTLSCELSLSSLKDFEGSGNLNAFPLERLRAVIPQQLPFDPLLLTGPTLTSSFSFLQKKGRQEVVFKASTPFLTASGAVCAENQTVSLLKPLQISWKPPQEETIKGLTITPNSSLDLLLSSLVFNIDSLDSLADITVDGILNVKSISYKDIPLSSFELKGKQTPKQTFSFSLMSLTNRGKIEAKGSYIYAKNSLVMQGAIDSFPLKLLDWIPKAMGEKEVTLSGILGDKLQGFIDGEISPTSGYLKASFQSPFATLSFAGKIKDGIFTLSEPLYSQIKMTPSLSRYLLGRFSSSTVSALHADVPLSLKIDPFDFSLPLYPFQPERISMGYGRIELGKLLCENKGNMSALLSLLKLGQFSSNQPLEIWFSPIEFHIKEQIVKCERTDLLIAQNYQICNWGEIDLNTQQVNMVIGLTAECLRKAFKIPNLPKDYVLQIPVTGPLSNVEINKSKATAKIAALLIWQQKGSAGEIIGGSGGALVGKFLDKLPLPDQDMKAPPPRRPLPWEEEGNPAPEEAKTKKKKTKFSDGENPLKQVLKIIR